MIPKFRAFWKSEKKMITDISWMRFDKEDLIGRIDGQTILPIGFSKVILMQSTGLFDKNGVEIFEGDVVKDCYGVYHLVQYNKEFCAFFLYPLVNPERFTGIYPKITLEVLGNIHENPELVEGGG